MRLNEIENTTRTRKTKNAAIFTSKTIERLSKRQYTVGSISASTLQHDVENACKRLRIVLEYDIVIATGNKKLEVKKWDERKACFLFLPKTHIEL